MDPAASKKPRGSAFVLSIVNGAKKKPGGDGGMDEEAPESEDEDGDVAKLSAARDILAAIKAGDALALSDALSAHSELCGGYE